MTDATTIKATTKGISTMTKRTVLITIESTLLFSAMTTILTTFYQSESASESILATIYHVKHYMIIMIPVIHVDY